MMFCDNVRHVGESALASPTDVPPNLCTIMLLRASWLDRCRKRLFQVGNQILASSMPTA